MDKKKRDIFGWLKGLRRERQSGDTNSGAGVVVGGTHKNRRGFNWRFAGLIVAAVVIAGGLGAAVRWYASRSASAPDPLPKVVEDVQNLRLESGNEVSDKKIAELLADSSTSQEDKYYLYVLQGDSAGEREDFQAAADAYAKALAIKETYEINSKLGGAWQGVGDKQKAVKYYTRAKELVPADLPTYNSVRERFDMLIEALQG